MYTVRAELFRDSDNLEDAVQLTRWERLGTGSAVAYIANLYRIFRDLAVRAAAWRDQLTEVLTRMTQPGDGNPEATSTLILTLRLDAAAQARFDAERAAHFPPTRRQPLRPHVTIQNKVGAEQARALHDRLRSGFTAFDARGTGLLLWHYRGGPWEPAAAFPFSDA